MQIDFDQVMKNIETCLGRETFDVSVLAFHVEVLSSNGRNLNESQFHLASVLISKFLWSRISYHSHKASSKSNVLQSRSCSLPFGHRLYL